MGSNPACPILVLNAGSSSVKLAVFGPERERRGTVERAPNATRLIWQDGPPATAPHDLSPDGDALYRDLLAALPAPPGAVAHRVVHGGDHPGPARVTEALLSELDSYASLAPLHEGTNLAAIRAISRLRPDLPQSVSFDTAFHRTMPDAARRFAIPRALHDEGLRRYGAHGLSYQFIATTLRDTAPELARGRVVVAHLGSGASVCALRGGESIDTSMGLTPLDGLVMSTRCGTVDPGLVLHLLAARGLAAGEVRELLYKKSGLLGVSGGESGDTRDLLRSHSEPAREALDLFILRLGKEIAAMAVSLSGLDALVFTGGIGAHQPDIRARAISALGFLGIVIDAGANEAGARVISAPHSGAAVMAIETDEERVIAEEARTVLDFA